MEPREDSSLKVPTRESVVDHQDFPFMEPREDRVGSTGTGVITLPLSATLTLRPLNLQEIRNVIEIREADGNHSAPSDSLNLMLGLIPSVMNHDGPVKKASTNPVLFIGFTGSGKSTTVNFLAGASMVQVDKKDGQVRYDVAPGGRLDLAGIGHDRGCSETLFAKEIFPIDAPGVKFIDCPGFDDSRGFEFDCAHAGKCTG